MNYVTTEITITYDGPLIPEPFHAERCFTGSWWVWREWSNYYRKFFTRRSAQRHADDMNAAFVMGYREALAREKAGRNS